MLCTLLYLYVLKESFLCELVIPHKGYAVNCVNRFGEDIKYEKFILGDSVYGVRPVVGKECNKIKEAFK